MRSIGLVAVILCVAPLAQAKRHAAGHPKRIGAAASSVPHRAGSTQPHRIGGMTYVSAAPLAQADPPQRAAHFRRHHH
jgi:hypothetical protein